MKRSLELIEQKGDSRPIIATSVPEIENPVTPYAIEAPEKTKEDK
jgi:hypothetical protein